MPMIGDLHSFALPDLLRTLGKSRQSGQLSIWSQNGVHRIWLSQGSVTAAIAPQAEGTLKALCLNLVNQSYESLLRALERNTTSLSEPFGVWARRQNWLTEEEQAQVFQLQHNIGLYPLFELASGQFYFVADKVPLPYWEMTGLELMAMDAIAQGLEFAKEKSNEVTNLPSLELKFLSLPITTTNYHLSLLDRRLLQWFKQPNTIQSLCQVLNVEPLELQKACKRLISLRMIKVIDVELPLVTQLPALSQRAEEKSPAIQKVASPLINHNLVKRIAAVLNTPVLTISNH